MEKPRNLKNLSEISAFLLVDKPVGWTSFDVCARIRKKLNVKRVGHTVTLDPFATGLLIVALGRATRLIPYLEKDRKTYTAQTRLGATSETLDPESEIIFPFNEGDIEEISQKKIQTILSEKFSGKISQIPPKYSALKIQGRKMCDLARKGQDFEIKPRETEIFSTEIQDYQFPFLTLKMTVAAGFYVRSFARDLGEELCGAGMCQSLRREAIEDLAVTHPQIITEKLLQESATSLLDFALDPREILSLKTLEIPADRYEDFRHGRAFPVENFLGESGDLLLTMEGRSIGVGEYRYGKMNPRILL